MDERVPEHRDSHASSSRKPSLEPMRSVDLGKHSIYTHFPKDQNCEICQRTKITRAPCRRRLGWVVPPAENLGDLISADHKVLSEGCESRNNHRYAVVVQDLATQWIQSYPCNTKTSQETQKSLQKFLEPNRKPKVIYTDNSSEFGKACEDLSWNHCTSTPHRSQTNGIAWRAVAQSERMYVCGTVAIRSEWKLVGRFHGMLSYLRNIHRSVIDGETPYERRFGTNRSVWFIGWVLPYFCERAVKNPSIWKESITWIVPRIRSVRGEEFGRVTWWLQTLTSWKRWTHRKSTRKDSMRKRWYFPNTGEFIFPIADGRIKTPGGDQELRTSTLIRPRPIQGEGHVDFLGESEGSLPPPQDSLLDAVEAINDFWSMSGNFIYRHHVEPRVKLYSPREESLPIPLKYIDVSRATHRWLLEYRWIKKWFLWFVDRFHLVCSVKWETSRRKNVVQERLTKRQLTSRPDHLWPEPWRGNVKERHAEGEV